MNVNWRLYGEQTVVSCLEQSELPGLFRKSLVIEPGEGVLVLRGGELGELLTETKVDVSGMWSGLASFFTKGSEITVYVLDLNPIVLRVFLGGEAETENMAPRSASQSDPFSLESFLRAAAGYGWVDGVEGQKSSASPRATSLRQGTLLAVTSDSQIMRAECRLQLKIQERNATRLVRLVKGKKALASWDLSALLQDELFAKVLLPEIAKHPAAELRRDREILHEIENATAKELMPLLDQIGLTLDSFSISWGLSDAEVYSIERKQAEFEEEGLEFAKKREIAHLRREQEIEKARLSNLQELKLAKSRGDEDLQDLLLAGEIRRDLLLKGSEVDTAKIEAQVREIQIGIERSESLARLEQRRAEEEFRLDLEDHEFKQKHEARLASLEAEDREMRSMVRMQIEMATAKHERQTAESRQKIDAEFRRLQAEVEDRYQQRKLKLDESMARMGMMERLVSQGLHSGAADSSVLNTMLRQATEQEYATTSDEKVKARAAAEAAANNLDTYRKAEDRDRQYHGTMTDLASGLMHAAKPAPREDRSRDPMQSTGHQGPYVSGNPFPPGSRNSCPSCRTPVQANWKACPECGASLHPNQKINCRNCGSPVDRAWKACPACGHTLEPHCRQCGNPVEAEWKACPSCGTSR